jgi:hypothetical protein
LKPFFRGGGEGGESERSKKGKEKRREVKKREI